MYWNTKMRETMMKSLTTPTLIFVFIYHKPEKWELSRFLPDFAGFQGWNVLMYFLKLYF
jgi:hypothetical protein